MSIIKDIEKAISYCFGKNEIDVLDDIEPSTKNAPINAYGRLSAKQHMQYLQEKHKLAEILERYSVFCDDLRLLAQKGASVISFFSLSRDPHVRANDITDFDPSIYSNCEARENARTLINLKLLQEYLEPYLMLWHSNLSDGESIFLSPQREGGAPIDPEKQVLMIERGFERQLELYLEYGIPAQDIAA